MKKIVKFLLYLICVLPFIGCSEGEIDDIEKNEESITSEYYVKYCYGCETLNRKYVFYVEYTSVSNNSIIQFVNSYEGWANKFSDEKICGPFKYGDHVSLKMNYSSMSNTFLEIYISKNNSPFALKKYDYISNTSGTGYIDYTIDY